MRKGRAARKKEKREEGKKRKRERQREREREREGGGWVGKPSSGTRYRLSHYFK